MTLFLLVLAEIEKPDKRALTCQLSHTNLQSSDITNGALVHPCRIENYMLVRRLVSAQLQQATPLPFTVPTLKMPNHYFITTNSRRKVVMHDQIKASELTHVELSNG